MKIAVIGAGFTGLAAADALVHQGHQVDVFDQDDQPGGLAIGFQDSAWRWPLEKHYHHLFTSDTAIRDLANHVGQPITFRRPLTSTWTQEGIYPLDSPISLLRFPALPVIDRLRTGAVLAFLKLNPFWRPLEQVTTQKFIQSTMGHRSWQVLWQPLMDHKFGRYSDRISASWFWARIRKRSPSLGYPDGGFPALACKIAGHVAEKGGHFRFGTGITQILASGPGLALTTASHQTHHYDRVICTLPSSLFLQITPGLPENYRHQLQRLTGIGAVDLVLSLKKPFLPDHIYWLNVNFPKAPFLAVVEQTNFVSPDNYHDRYLLYVGNYLPPTHEYFSKTAPQLLTEFLPYLKKINPGFDRSWVDQSWLWTAPFAQPVIPVNYSRTLPSLTTPIKHLYLANMQQVYPWDRGTNYAVELGNKVAQICLTS